MDDRELQQFEDALRRSRPSRLPAGFSERVDAARRKDDGKADNIIDARDAFQWFRPLLNAAAVAAVVFGLILFFSPGQPPADSVAEGESVTNQSVEESVQVPRGWQPVKAGNTVEDAHDDGIIYSGDGVLSRSIRYKFTDNYRWVNPETGATIEFSIPHESRIVVPVETD
ncbi:MAG: hypothetical protein AAGJ79_13355 [Verrucomicrobiota bacterium]